MNAKSCDIRIETIQISPVQQQWGTQSMMGMGRFYVRYSVVWCDCMWIYFRIRWKYLDETRTTHCRLYLFTFDIVPVINILSPMWHKSRIIICLFKAKNIISVLIAMSFSYYAPYIRKYIFGIIQLFSITSFLSQTPSNVCSNVTRLSAFNSNNISTDKINPL